MARDVIRQVQDLRKKTGLQMEDRITLYLATADEPLRRAIEVQWDYIAGETLATKRAEAPLDGATKTKIEGKELTIGLKRGG
jgi:isoleucyl-tRNA synthetase